jgi:hypothetical protein
MRITTAKPPGMSFDTGDAHEAAKRMSELEAARMRNAVLGDLRMVGILSIQTLRKRWRIAKVTAADLRTARTAYARERHPDRAADPVEANRQDGGRQRGGRRGHP